jgi:hypothetical protein
VRTCLPFLGNESLCSPAQVHIDKNRRRLDNVGTKVQASQFRPSR